MKQTEEVKGLGERVALGQYLGWELPEAEETLAVQIPWFASAVGEALGTAFRGSQPFYIAKRYSSTFRQREQAQNVY
jgi:hypothetical protein